MKAAKLFLTFLAAFAALQMVYPWQAYYGEFKFGWATTLVSYLVLAGIMAGLGGLVSPRVVGKLVNAPGQGWKRSLLVALACFLLLVGLALLFSGPGLSLNVPETRIQGIFFAEWKFVNFILQIGLPFSIFVAMVDRWKRKREA